MTSVDGQPVRDVIDWRWLSAEERITVGYIDLDGDEGEVELWRDPGEDWGFEFEGLVFDGVRQCRNACTFCFMHQLPHGMRRSLYLRDDDYRLSFLVGTFVTLTNIRPEDERRIVEQRISPLRVSLQVVDPDVRRRMIGRHAQHGIDALERLLAAGIQFHAQIVLVPGENDGDVLRRTLEWAYARPGILGVGIVPLGYTRHQRTFDRSFNDAESSRAVLDLIAPFQQRAQRERGNAWVFAADEFHRNAWRDDLLSHLPAADHYGDFSMFEDGIGIIRSTVDDWRRAEQEGAIARCATELRGRGAVARMIAGQAQREFLNPLIAESGIADCFSPLYVRNDFFGGNVDVTGLLTGQDIVKAIQQATAKEQAVRQATMEKQPSGPGAGPEAACGRFRSGQESGTGKPSDARTSPQAASGLAPGPEGGQPARGLAPGPEGGQPARIQPSTSQESERRQSSDARTSPQAASGPAPGPEGGRDARGPAPGPEGGQPARGLAPGPEGGRIAQEPFFLIPSVIFNDDARTLDDQTLEDMEKAAGTPLRMVSCSPKDYFDEIYALIAS